MAYAWIDVDFRPAPAGWRVVYVWDEDKKTLSHVPVAGWLLQVRDGSEPGDPERRVVPAVHDWQTGNNFELTPAECVHDVWSVLGPGDPDLTADDIQADLDGGPGRL